MKSICLKFIGLVFSVLGLAIGALVLIGAWELRIRVGGVSVWEPQMPVVGFAFLTVAAVGALIYHRIKESAVFWKRNLSLFLLLSGTVIWALDGAGVSEAAFFAGDFALLFMALAGALIDLGVRLINFAMPGKTVNEDVPVPDDVLYASALLAKAQARHQNCLNSSDVSGVVEEQAPTVKAAIDESQEPGELVVLWPPY